MTPVREGVCGRLRWAAAGRAFEGEAVSGDRFTVVERGGRTFVAVVDGLGHGAAAGEAAALACRVVEQASASGVEALLGACHDALRTTRGAVMTVAGLDDEALEWAGVGNVEALLLCGFGARRVRPMLPGGVVGHALPKLRATRHALAAGDLLVLATDGLAGRALDAVDATEAPAAVACGLLERFASGRDDALVFAARFEGARS